MWAVSSSGDSWGLSILLSQTFLLLSTACLSASYMPGAAPRVLRMLTCLICQAPTEQVLAFPPLYRCWY